MKELNHFCKKLLVLVLTLAGYLNTVAQEQNIPLQHSDLFVIIEAGVFGTTGSVNPGITTSSFGIYNYMHIQNFSGKRNSTIGIAIPLRGFYSENGMTSENIKSMASIAALFQTKIQLHPEKDKWWMSIGAGPEYRWLDRERNRSVFMVQLEASFKRFSETSLIKYVEIGITSSHLPNKHMVQGLNAFAGFFVRASIF